MIRFCLNIGIALLLTQQVFSANAIFALDSIPPVFNINPQSKIVQCDDALSIELVNWLNLGAGAEADFGEAEIINLTSNQEAILLLTEAFTENCQFQAEIEIGFIAIDSCQNQSIDTLFASFVVEDNDPPIFINETNSATVACNPSTSDSLYNWLQSYGGATAEDNCSDSIFWINYTWADNLGNNGFSEFGDTVFQNIPRDSCAWYVDVTFFVRDDCENINATSGRFEIEKDTIQPSLLSALVDQTILCGESIDTIVPQYQDECQDELEIILTETNDRSIDSTNCAFYNYTLERIWSAIDICGNMKVDTQTFHIVDTIPPQLNFESILAIDCNEDVSDTLSFLTATDNCSVSNITFSDSTLVSSGCQNQIERTWIVSDVCQNISEAKQIIQIQDFTPPEFIQLPLDTILDCSSSNVELVFENWISSFGKAIVEDNCSALKFATRTELNIVDTFQVLNTTPVELQLELCKQGDLNNQISFSQKVNFIVYDDCGNLSQAEANFILVDTIAPTILECPLAQNIILLENECDADYWLNLPSFSDNCETEDSISWSVNIDGFFDFTPEMDSFQINLEVGEHQVDYRIFDCVGNLSSCIQNITITDTFPPQIECAESLTSFLGPNECDFNFTTPDLQSYSDNCFGNTDFSKTLPSGEAYINFKFNDQIDQYQAEDFPLEFENILTEGRLFKPSIILDYRLKTDDGSSVNIISEFGDLLYTIENENCERKRVKVLLDENQFAVWSSDMDIKFTILFEDGTGQGILPCDTTAVDGAQDIDEISFLSLTLEFSDIVPQFQISDSLGTIISDNQLETTLGLGEYDLLYQTEDQSGNLSECLTTVSIVDTISPTIICSDIEYKYSITENDTLEINIDDLDFITEDNCQILNIILNNNKLVCDDIGTEKEVGLLVLDESGNRTVCTQNVTILADTLSPTFVSGLCLADSLKLFSNTDPNLVSSYLWTGPNNFNSTQSNPILTSIDDDNSGTYNLQVVSQSGCQFFGEINVQVNLFSSPEITTDNLTACLGEELLLNSNSFTEIVDYFWYEGISPNGTLIAQSDGPTVSVMPTVGTHFYYVEAQGDNCNSNPSNTLEIEVLAIPEAVIDNPFITICEGQDIALTSSSFDQNYEYEWRGPDNYFSNGLIPMVISDANQNNAGNYTFVIKDRDCISDTANAQVIIFEPPPKPIIDGETVFCEGQSAVLTVINIPTATRYHWYNNGQFFSSVSTNNLLIPAIDNDKNGTWTVVVEDGICSSDTSDRFEIFIESVLNIGASNNGPLCEGDIVRLTSSFIPNATYQWQDPQGAFYDGREIDVQAFEGLYTVTLTTQSNCIATTSTFVEVGQRPTITALSNTSVPCTDGNMPITFVPTVFPQGNYQYEWTGPNGFSSNLENPQIQNPDEDSNGSYTLSVIQGNCKSELAETNIDLTIKPAQPEISTDLIPCEGENINIRIINPITNINTNWIWSTPIGQVETQIANLSIDNFNINNIGNYSVIQELNGCRSESSEEIVIDIQNSIPTPVISSQASYCENEEVTIQCTDLGTANYIWTTPIGEVITNEAQLTINNFTIDNVGSYSIQLENGSCISSESQVVNIDIVSSPATPSFVNNLLSLCASENNELIICLNDNGADFDLIRIIDNESQTIISESPDFCQDLSFLLNNNSRSYELIAVSVKDGCQSEESEILNLNLSEIPNEKAEFSTDLIVLCDQEFTNVSIPSTSVDIDIDWSSPDPDINIILQDDFNASLSNLRFGINEIIIFSSSGDCENYASDTIVINLLENLEANDDLITVGLNEEVIFLPTVNDELNSAVSFELISEPEEGELLIDNQELTFTSPNNYIGVLQFDYEVCYIACDNLCDRASIQITIEDDRACFAGNIITPNEDGYNDNFMIPCLSSGNYENNSLVIFNQWGDEVYSAAPYLNDWKGTYNNNPLPVGTYFYILDLGDGSKPIQDFIILEQ